MGYRIFEIFVFFILAVIVAFLSGAGCSGPSTPGPGKGWNIVMISIDALRADHLGCYGYERNTSPCIDQAVQNGFLFNKAFVQAPHTHSSLASVMTGTYPLRHNSVIGSRLLEDDSRMLAGMLGEHSYRTGAFVQNFWLSEEVGFTRGFDDFYHSRVSITESNVEESIRAWLLRQKEGPFFLWLHYLEPHADFLPHEPYVKEFLPDYDGPYFTFTNDMVNLYKDKTKLLSPEELTFVKAAYDSEIRYCDDAVGRIFKMLQDYGFNDDTLIIILADHGEELQDRGKMGHDHTLYNELLRIPLIFHAPGVIKPGKDEANVVESVDIAPTIMEFLGLEIPQSVQGRSLLDIMNRKDAGARTTGYAQRFFYTKDSHLFSIIDYPWKLIVQLTGIDRSDIHNWRLEPQRCRVNMYNLENDPEEKNNISFQNRQKAMQMLKQLQSWSRIHRIPYFKESFDEEKMGEELIENLKSLGYLQ